MTGTILATILAVLFAQFAVGGVLLAAFRLKRPKEAKPTPERHVERYVTSEQLDAAIEKVAKDLEWEWTEMYEKFEKLHLRLAKRDARAKSQQGAQQEPEQQEVLDIRRYRRL